MKSKGILVVVSGFAGAGKGTLMKRLLSDYDNYALSVSATSRKPRPGEIEGISYFFKTKDEFEKMIENGELLEHACYVGNYYGTPEKFVCEQLEAGKDVILEIEIQGAMQIKKKFPEALLLFVTPPSVKILKNRLVGRGTETADVVEQRMKRAAEEAEGIDEYDFILVNDDIDICTGKMHNIIQSAKYMPLRQRAFIEEIRKELRIYS